MGALPAAARIRHDLHTRLLDARSRTDELFSMVREQALYGQPIPERHRIIFYLGHVEAFDWNLLAQRAFGLRSFNASFDHLFAFGIDPVDGSLPDDQPSDWPKREEIERYNRRVREALDVATEEALEHPEEGHPHLLAMLETALEHRLMHAETLAYMLHRMPVAEKVPGQVRLDWATSPAKRRLIEIPAGRATLGLAEEDGTFGWDNELGTSKRTFPLLPLKATMSPMRSFFGSSRPAAMSDALWTTRTGTGRRRMACIIRPSGAATATSGFIGACSTKFALPRDWPVYVSHAEASAYARWAGRELPTEAQWHRAAYGTPEGDGAPLSLGRQAAHARTMAISISGVGIRRPSARFPPARALSACPIWWATAGSGRARRSLRFPALPISFYPGYSANFFDGKHYVMKGGSPRTAACMLRRSFRNWFQPHYPYMYTALSLRGRIAASITRSPNR